MSEGKTAESVRIAGIDCGTNSIRLMIADVSREGMRVLVPKTMEVVRLGEGVDHTHRFAEDALERTYAACRHFESLIRKTGGVQAVRFVATSATRDARNRQEFEDTVESILHTRPEVIPGTMEAALSFLGATSALPPHVRRTDAPLLVVDLGGGSTELGLGGLGEEADLVRQSVSLNIGSVRMSERHLKADPATPGQIEEASADIDAHLREAFARLDLGSVRTLIGVSGTVTTVSLIAMGSHDYLREAVDGAHVRIDRALAACSDVLGMSTAEMAHDWPVINPGRRDVIGGGALVWSRLLTLLQSETAKRGHRLEGYTASERGLLDGAILDAGRRILAAGRSGSVALD